MSDEERKEASEFLANYQRLQRPTREAFLAALSLSLAAQTVAEKEAVILASKPALVKYLPSFTNLY